VNKIIAQARLLSYLWEKLMSIFYDPYAHTEKYHRNLPHWCQEGKIVFVTFRLADSIPADRLRQLQADRDLWKRNHPQMTSPDHWLEYPHPAVTFVYSLSVPSDSKVPTESLHYRVPKPANKLAKQ
jgi:hypothetical protein